MNVAGPRENVGSKVVQHFGIQCFNCKQYGHFAKEGRKSKRVKDSVYHKEKMLLYKQAEQGVPLQAAQYDCKSLGESTSVRDSCLVALQTKQAEFEKFKAFNDRTIDYNKLEHVKCSYLQSLSDLDALPELQCIYLHKVKECDCLAQKLSNQTDSEMHVDLKYVKSLEKEIDELKSEKAEFSDMYDVILQECVKECDCLAQRLSKQTESISKKVHTELLQRFAKLETRLISLEIALQKAKLQDKNIAISELKKLIEKGKGKSVDTKFDRPSVVQQPNAQRIPKPSVLGKPTPFSNSLNRIYFQKTKSVSKANVLEGVNHNTNVSRPQLKSKQSKDKVLPYNSQVKAKKTQVEVHPRFPNVSNKTKYVTACKDISNSRTLNANVVCATCNKCLIDSNHFACVTKMLNDVHARTKKPTVVPISTRKPKLEFNYASLNLISNEMMSNVNVLGPGVLDVIVTESNATTIVIIQENLVEVKALV
nr:hypothetical protein [Tanacetum cinerariifolium]